MSPSRDAFGFTSKAPPKRPQGTNPLTVVAQPGQEIRVVIADDGVGGAGSQDSGDSGPRGSPSGDSGPRGSPSGDSGPRGSPSGDSGPRSSPSGDAFGFKPLPRGFSPTPITVVAHSGQEIRIVVPDRTGSSGA